jgi:hypothetical protein
MNCNEVRQHWMLYLDSEGDPELHLRIRNHLGGCAVCARWFAEQQRLEQEIGKCLSTGVLTPELWNRVGSKATVPPGIRARRGKWPLLTTLGATAAVLLALVIFFQLEGRSPSTDLTRNAADLHGQWLRGNVRPDFVSSSDQEVDRYFKTSVPFKVHCPPRTDVDFQVQGAGVFFMKDRHQAAYIVGHVGKAPVSIVVLDRASLDGLPTDRFDRCREGDFLVVSKVIAENVVVVIGSASPEVLERLLNAYGTYPEG